MYAVKNKVQLIGNLGQDPEIKSYGDDKKVAYISIATNENYRNAKGDKVTDTQWHNVVVWGKLVDIVEKYLVKGIEVIIEGRLINRAYTDKQGAKKLVTEVHAHELMILTKRA